MKILYITTGVEDYLSDGILYGLRKLYGPDVVDFPKKESMYVNYQEDISYGSGFTLWRLLPDLNIDREHVREQIEAGYYDIIVFSDIFRQLEVFAHWNVYKLLEQTREMGKKIVFLDGTDDGKVTITETFQWGTYFKRENPFNYPEVKIIGLSIPQEKILPEKPKKTKPFVRYCQVPEAYQVWEIQQMCSNERFADETEYYADMAASKFGFAMKKSGWDTPRTIEQAGCWAVNCIYTPGWEWDNIDWYHRPKDTHPLGLEDMKNCILWDTPQQLVDKIKSINDVQYEKMSRDSHDWALTKTCEKVARYVMDNI